MKVKEQIRYGRITYFSFLLLDLICLVISNVIAVWLYDSWEIDKTFYSLGDHCTVIVMMCVIDICVTLFLNTLSRVLRRRKRIEMLQGVKHIGVSFVFLAVILFTFRQGADFSRFTVYLGYGIYYLLWVGSHVVWRNVLKLCHKPAERPTAILMTTDRFVNEGLAELKEQNVDVKAIFLLKNIRKDSFGDIPTAADSEETGAIMCWNRIDRAYVYGLDHQMIPAELQRACWEMDMPLQTIDFEYKVIELKTIANADPKYGALSFLEGKRDIPFPIRRVYWITETEADLHRGFHAHKLNCQLLFCPHGKIDILLDDGRGTGKTSVTLEGPDKGLLLMPGMWREMVWQETGSVLCVLASEYYDPDEYIRNYDEFLAYRGLSEGAAAEEQAAGDTRTAPEHS